MKSFLAEIEKKFIDLDQIDDETFDTPEDELDEQNVTGAIAGYEIPGAFTSEKKFKKKKFTWAGGQVNESVNTKPTYSLKDETHQRPESPEEEYSVKFPFAESDKDWQHKEYVYPSVDLTNTPGTARKKDYTQKNKIRQSVEEILEKKYEQLIEGYRDFKSGDVKPSNKVKSTIQEIAKKLQEIETLVNYNSKLKTESGVTSSAYGPGTQKALSKISERLIKISERVRSLGE